MSAEFQMEQPRPPTVTSASTQKRLTPDPAMATRDVGIILELTRPEVLHPHDMVRQIAPCISKVIILARTVPERCSQMGCFFHRLYLEIWYLPS
jgi:hypothetical protein